MSNEKDKIVLQKMMERIQRTRQYCSGKSYADFEDDIMLQEACVFNILQISEMAKQKLSPAITEANLMIPWKQIYGLRNRIVHGYEGVRLNIVWDTIQEDFPILLEQLVQLVSTL